MKKLQLRNGGYALVDNQYEYLNQYNWRAKPNGYIDAWIEGKYVLLHRLITSAPKGMFVDHKNHDIKDNRISNLRVCTRSQNAHNTRLPKNNTSGYKGVIWYKRHSKFMATIKVDNKKVYIGYFDTAQEAGEAYRKKAVELFGEYAYVG